MGRRLSISALALLVLLPASARAIVVRHDLAPADYVLTPVPNTLADLPHEGHGVLIHPRWVLTVAHTVFYDYAGKHLILAGKPRAIARVVTHPGFAEPGEELLSGEGGPLMDFFFRRDDIALIELSEPVGDVAPLPIYRGSGEGGRIVEIIGRGATGTGRRGEQSDTKDARTLRRARNRVERVRGNWLVYAFDPPPDALELEGMHGSGDSGGPVVITEHRRPHLAGLSSWQRWEKDLAAFRGGLYGTRAYAVRVSAYQKWIDATIGGASR